MRMLLREFVREFLVEYAPQENVVLYHRSMKKFKVGDVLSGGHSSKNKLDSPVELALEEYRQKHHPDLPSRMNCVYMTFIPRSRFVNYGKLYAVKPNGNMFVSDSMLIDKMLEDKDRSRSYGSSEYEYTKDDVPYYLVERYWKGVEPNRGNTNDLEVIAESATVTEIIEEHKRVQRDDVVEFGSGVVIKGTVSLFSDSKAPDVYYAYDSARGKASFEQVTNDLKAQGISTSMKSNFGRHDLDVVLSAGFVGKVLSARTQSPGNKDPNAGYQFSTTLCPIAGSLQILLYPDETKKFNDYVRKGLIKITKS